MVAVTSRERTPDGFSACFALHPLRRGVPEPRRPDQRGRQHRTEADGAGRRAASCDPRSRPRPAAGANPPGVLLRHPRPETRRTGRRRARAQVPEEGRRLGGEAAAGRAVRAAALAPAFAELRHRARRVSPGLRRARGRAKAFRRKAPSGRQRPAGRRSASCSRRSSRRCTPSTRRRELRSTTCRCSARSSA